MWSTTRVSLKILYVLACKLWKIVQLSSNIFLNRLTREHNRKFNLWLLLNNNNLFLKDILAWTNTTLPQPVRYQIQMGKKRGHFSINPELWVFPISRWIRVQKINCFRPAEAPPGSSDEIKEDDDYCRGSQLFWICGTLIDKKICLEYLSVKRWKIIKMVLLTYFLKDI